MLNFWANYSIFTCLMRISYLPYQIANCRAQKYHACALPHGLLSAGASDVRAAVESSKKPPI